MTKAKKAKKTIGVAGKRAKTFPRKSAKKAAPKKVKKLKLTAINVKLTPATLKELQVRAKKFTEGNVSALLRHAGLWYRPEKGEKIPFKVEL